MQAAHELQRVGVAVVWRPGAAGDLRPARRQQLTDTGVVEDLVLVAGVAGRLPETCEHRIEIGKIVLGERGHHPAGARVARREPAILDERSGEREPALGRGARPPRVFGASNPPCPAPTPARSCRGSRGTPHPPRREPRPSARRARARMRQRPRPARRRPPPCRSRYGASRLHRGLPEWIPAFSPFSRGRRGMTASASPRIGTPLGSRGRLRGYPGSGVRGGSTCGGRCAMRTPAPRTGARWNRPRLALKPGGCFARQSHIRLRRMS